LVFFLEPLTIADEGTVFFKIVGNESPSDINIPEDLNPYSLVDLVDRDRSVS
jgi:hypothetical protein